MYTWSLLAGVCDSGTDVEMAGRRVAGGCQAEYLTSMAKREDGQEIGVTLWDADSVGLRVQVLLSPHIHRGTVRKSPHLSASVSFTFPFGDSYLTYCMEM